MNCDKLAIAELASLSDAEALHTIAHYVYVPSPEAAASIASQLRRHGFRTEERLGADGLSWLVLARHEAVPSEAHIASTRQLMEALVADVAGGNYDGWEAEVHRRGSGLSRPH